MQVRHTDERRDGCTIAAGSGSPFQGSSVLSSVTQGVALGYLGSPLRGLSLALRRNALACHDFLSSCEGEDQREWTAAVRDTDASGSRPDKHGVARVTRGPSRGTDPAERQRGGSNEKNRAQSVPMQLEEALRPLLPARRRQDRKSTRLNSSHRH